MIYFRMLGSGIRWTNLHPQRLVESMKSFNFNFPFDTLDDFMKRVSQKFSFEDYQNRPDYLIDFLIVFLKIDFI